MIFFIANTLLSKPLRNFCFPLRSLSTLLKLNTFSPFLLWLFGPAESINIKINIRINIIFWIFLSFGDILKRNSAISNFPSKRSYYFEHLKIICCIIFYQFFCKWNYHLWSSCSIDVIYVYFLLAFTFKRFFGNKSRIGFSCFLVIKNWKASAYFYFDRQLFFFYFWKFFPEKNM